MKKLKEGMKVIPNEDTFDKWHDYLTRGKKYAVVNKHYLISTDEIYLVVYDDGGVQYWAEPHKYFTQIHDKNVIGGKLL